MLLGGGRGGFLTASDDLFLLSVLVSFEVVSVLQQVPGPKKERRTGSKMRP